MTKAQKRAWNALIAIEDAYYILYDQNPEDLDCNDAEEVIDAMKALEKQWEVNAKAFTIGMEKPDFFLGF